jgi:hypothetical protein
MAIGPALPGGGVDPLFTVIFVFVTLLNLTAAIVPSPTRVELAVIGLMHGAFLLRLVRARWAASRQRAVDLESYRAMRMRMSNGKE